MSIFTTSHDVYASLRPSLPDHCTPTSPALETISSYTHTCIPTPLALISTLVGTLSIFSWLFAQLPQIITNYRLKSTAGLSIFFLVEWCLGDLSNLFGALLTNQAAWQVIIGIYYCFVDIMMVGQWVWYERLKHGKPLKRIWLRSKRWTRKADVYNEGEVLEGQEPRVIKQPVIVEDHTCSRSHKATIQESDVHVHGTSPRDIPTSKAASAMNSMFHTPIYGTISPNTRPATPFIASTAASSARNSPPSRGIHRPRGSQQSLNNLPTASPRSVLFISMLVALASTSTSVYASPISSDASQPSTASSSISSYLRHHLGTLLSWSSTFLYLASRLPQLFLNLRRRSVAGLSFTLFLAAFCGNMFYSASLLLNPCAWEDFGPYGGHGWVGEEGSAQSEWVQAALPFFLGAAGVLLMDGAVGVQFWVYGDGNSGAPGSDEEVLVVREEHPRARKNTENGGTWEPSTVDTTPGDAASRVTTSAGTSGRGGGTTTSTQPSKRGPSFEKRYRVRKVSGWMRGWMPGTGVLGAFGGASGRISPEAGETHRRAHHRVFSGSGAITPVRGHYGTDSAGSVAGLTRTRTTPTPMQGSSRVGGERPESGQLGRRGGAGEGGGEREPLLKR
ncbi:MAG: hypothetical protein M1831_004221 [Alyxoria varia]|nr:MAG: hypothetical protein M1831_004221 [Alyxoria varia]